MIVPLLLSELGRVDGLGNTDVQFSNGDLEVGARKSGEGSNKVGETADDQVGLGSDTVNGGSAALDAADEGDLLEDVQVSSQFSRVS